MADPILFFRLRDPHGAFSNFSRYTVRIFGERWLTSEHAYQAAKFLPTDPSYAEIRDAPTPRIAADKGRDPSRNMRPEWDSPVLASRVGTEIDQQMVAMAVDDGNGSRFVIDRYKDMVMFQIVEAKFKQHEPLTELLLSTGDAPIVEASPMDSYWGYGADRRGLNKLGRILMAVRTRIREGR